MILLKTGEFLTTATVVVDVECPNRLCGAQPGSECIGRRGPRRSAHAERWSAWATANRHRVLGIEAQVGRPKQNQVEPR